MIPVQLIIQGLYSYQEKQTVDFTTLTSAHLFGIFGTVGSGKSTILEAITFALYGRTDRLNLSGDNRYYNMMNLKSNELLIDFIFESGREQTAYRSVVRGKRNTKNFGEVKTLERMAYRGDNGEWRPVPVESLEEVIGLSYDNFKRTIIIPQGQFQEFLQLGNKDRTQMMKELFNLGKYEFFYKVTSLESKNNTQKQHIEGQLQQLGDISQEQAAGYQEQMGNLEKELAELGNRMAAIQKEEEHHRKLRELTGKLALATKTWEEKKTLEPGFLEMEAKINRYEQCVVQFRHLLETTEKNRRKLQERETLIREAEENLRLAEREIAKLETLVNQLKPAYENRERLKQQAVELDQVKKIKALEDLVQKEEDRLKKGRAICLETSEKLDHSKKERENLEKEIRTARENLPDITLLSNVKAWYVEMHNLERQFKEGEAELQRLVQEELKIRDEWTKILKEPFFATIPADADYEECVKYLQDKSREIKQLLKELESETGHARVKLQLQMYAEELEEGKPCPLCGSLHHPRQFVAEDIKEFLHAMEKRRAEVENAQEQTAQYTSRLGQLNNQMTYMGKHREELIQKRDNRLDMQRAHHARFVWEKFREETALDRAFREAERLQSEIKQKEVALNEKVAETERQEKNRERYQAELDRIQNDLTVHETELDTIGKQLMVIEQEKYRQASLADMEGERQMLLQQYAQIEKEFDETSRLLSTRTKTRDTLEGSLAVNRKEFAQEISNLQELSAELDIQLAKSGYKSVDEVKQILEVSVDPELEKKKIARFKEELVSSRTELERLLNEKGDQDYNEKAHNELVGQIAELAEVQKLKNQDLGKTGELLKKLQNDLAIQVSLKEELGKLEIRAENIKTMKSLFKAGGFVNYISSVYLQNLCNAANDRFFQLTRQKLSLEITPDNNFQVRDFMNEGKVRSVKTLSGGQTFQAALSLALALADNIQKITGSNQNFFFLDEGFGSLDRESLSVVFDTLKSLRKENRIVGVISHVEEMQQEIDVHLRVVNHEERGSLIRSAEEMA